MYLLDLKRSPDAVSKAPSKRCRFLAPSDPETEPCKAPKLEGPDMNIDMHMTKYILKETEVSHKYVYVSTKK